MTSRPGFFILTLASALAIVGCAHAPAAAPVVGPENSVASFVGEWSGEFASREAGRSGSIVLHFDAGDTTAFGDVLMTPRAQKPVAIAVIRVAGVRVTGLLPPHIDHDSTCAELVEFVGRRVSANEMKGTFTTHIPGTAIVQSGEWSATRSRSR
jgi:hypothetical protein